MGVVSELQSKILTRTLSPEDYRVYRAGLEWDLVEPIIIENADDLKSKKFWRDRVTPYHHQVTNLMTFCRRLPVTLLADDVGLGKTISAGLIMSELISRARLSKMLIVCPKLLAPQWKEELETKFDISAEIATGKELLTANPDDIGAVITTYNSARMYLEAIPSDRFQMLVLDEAHKLRNLYGVEKTPQVAKTFRKALEERRFRFVLMLTATPIQNRLWDLYSLVDLLTVARGHENPFGSDGMFARRFIADRRDQARQLNLSVRDEFRNIVYGYMSRVRRADAKLYFPDRVVQMHRVNPTADELELIKAIAVPIQKLNRLAQISILQALTSSPEALSAQLKNMARNRTVPEELAITVSAIVAKMPLSAKLKGLETLIEKLKKENLERWRLVIFTGRRETQTTIQAFLEERGLKVGIINGESGARNQETLAKFRKNPPECRVIVSTEAGSEGVNLQVANVLVNYDLPWNPMIVEQRIGRVQRLASEHAHVSIFNIMLRGTFEEYIVGRLMEKLQMASHAIGDIEALLQASDIGEGEEEGAKGFEDQILELVLAALAGKDVTKDTQLKVQSIENAKAELARSEETINSMLGSMDGKEYVGPRAPRLPNIEHAMDSREFTLGALKSLGVTLTEKDSGLYRAEEEGGWEYIRFGEAAIPEVRSTLYSPGSPAFQRLVSRVIASGVHHVTDLDVEPAKTSEAVARSWVSQFGGDAQSVEIENGVRSFGGNALLRVRATVAHDSYERLVEAGCSHENHHGKPSRSALAPLPKTIEEPLLAGLDAEKLTQAAQDDEAISEFCRFYMERREQELKSAGSDERKRKKLEDDFTPRLQVSLVGLDGEVHRDVNVRVRYSFGGHGTYESKLTVAPHDGQVVQTPEMRTCSKTGQTVPVTCLEKCAITGAEALRHLLVASEISERYALPECSIRCSMGGKRILQDEGEASAVTGKIVAKNLLKTSALSGRRAGPEFFATCEFTGAEVIGDELAASEISGKRYRVDQQMRSAASGKSGHRTEFITCYETREPIAISESEQCELTGRQVRRGILQTCEVTGKRVLPSELERCAFTGKRGLRQFFVTSSVSQARVLETSALRSSKGTFCTPAESQFCVWSGQKYHPDDLRTCALTGLPIYFEFATLTGSPRLRPLVELLDGIKRTTDEIAVWNSAASAIGTLNRANKCKVEAAVLSPAKTHLAMCCEVKTLLGLRTNQLGAIFDLGGRTAVGRMAVGKRGNGGWLQRGA
ncbi:MAG: SNF2-related protein [Acidobacteriaceae bacterium]